MKYIHFILAFYLSSIPIPANQTLGIKHYRFPAITNEMLL